MATPRVALASLLRASRFSTQYKVRHFRAFPSAPRLVIQHPQFKRSSSTSAPQKTYSFSEVSALSANPTSDKVLIDTREPGELQTTGTIPGSINIPVSSQPDSFFLTAEEFEDRYGFERPSKETEVIFFCKAGVRSRVAAGLAREAGWEKVGEYPGSWLDWEKQGGETGGGSEGK